MSNRKEAWSEGLKAPQAGLRLDLKLTAAEIRELRAAADREVRSIGNYVGWIVDQHREVVPRKVYDKHADTHSASQRIVTSCRSGAASSAGRFPEPAEITVQMRDLAQ
jgi:hypothetical protein